ncbi:MAG TPA: TraB/GumN family protein [Chitinophagaceae bacterium]|nr:TraB/GumN family protein [Chitinophagaceae bacterium]
MRTTLSKLPLYICLLSLLPLKAFNQGPKKYQSLLWEITGNGLKHPSYLFGTMHVSGKLVFHLADSFYYALKNVEVVAIELNPEVWQPEMVKMDNLQSNYKSFVQSSPTDYLNERSFRLENYEEQLKAALQSEPTVVNNLLYRTYKPQEDFEENTFLDLYIYQTAKKLNKITTGVEDYFSTEKIVMEAYADMAKEKNHDNSNLTESPYELEKKSEDAYRRGDLDLLDSIETILQGSKAFREKFLLARNVIQANSIDTILKKHSLFVGVGAAHLPGDRGVIELLRKKGYKLRPVKLNEKNAFLQNTIDKQKVPVNFHTYADPDGAYSVSVPGNLYKMSIDVSGPDRYQYADMSNGSYYMITRVQTYSAFGGDAADKVYKKADSLLYENIPGKIIEKKQIQLQGYNGFDITNKTRSGDVQRYQIYVTPFEILIFKMSGKESYVIGPEADEFFGSVKLPELKNQPVQFEPLSGGFTVRLPQQPHQFLNTAVTDGVDRWEYEADDSVTGNSFLILKKTINNFNFLDEDTFDLSLVNESFRASKFIQKEITRKYETFNNYPCMDVRLKTDDGDFVSERIMVRGAQYFLLAARSRDSSERFSSFFSSFKFSPFRYSPPKEITDTFMHFTVMTPVVPQIDPGFRSLFEGMINSGSFGTHDDSYLLQRKHAFFKSDSTGEIIAVSMQQLPRYYHADSRESFNKNEEDDYLEDDDMVLLSVDSFKTGNGIMAYRFVVTDTNTSRCIQHVLILNKDRVYRIAAMTDTLKEESPFVKTFISTFKPAPDTSHFDLFAGKNDLFFRDFYAKDSATHAKVLKAFADMDFTKEDIPRLLSVLKSLPYGDKDYFDTKSRVIRALGSIREKGSAPAVVKALKQVYESAGDTLTFQNDVMKALAENESDESYSLLKQLLTQDPPIFENTTGYSDFFDDFRDSLQLARKLFPDILQLLTIDDYKDNLTSLLATLSDSGLIASKDYEDYFTKIYFDAKLEMKRQQAKDEKMLDKSDDDNNDYSGTQYDYYPYLSASSSNVYAYSKLLMPFYDKEISVAKYMDKLLHSNDRRVQMNTAVLFLKYKKDVPDSIVTSIAKSDIYRADFYERLKSESLESKFPASFRSKEQMARSILAGYNSYNKMDSVAFVSADTITYNGQKALVYFYKYRMNDNDDWKMGLSGTQPLSGDAINTESDGLTSLTGDLLQPGTDQRAQFLDELHKMLIASHPGGKQFYYTNQSYGGYDN